MEDRISAAPPLDLLVNNAGIALSEPFPDNGLDAEESLLALSVLAVLRLAHAVLPGMIERRSGRVVNVGSFTSLGPGGLATTHPAGKAWVHTFTESPARSRRLREAGVRMMALLPGFTTGTDIFRRAGAGGGRARAPSGENLA